MTTHDAFKTGVCLGLALFGLYLFSLLVGIGPT